MIDQRTLKEKTAKGLFWGGLSNGLQQLLNLIFGLILARILTAEDYGIVGTLAVFSAIASTIQESGFTVALTNKKDIRNEDFNAVFWFSVLSGIIFYVILFFFSPLIARFYGCPELISLSRIVFLGFLLGGVGIASNAYLFKSLMVKEKAKIDIIALICSGIVGIILALNDFAYYGIGIQTVVYMGIGSLLKLYIAPWKPCFKFNFSPLKEMFGFSFKLVLINILTQISSNIFSVILGKFYNPQQLGFYLQGQKWMVMGYQLIGGTISGVAQPVLVEASDDIARQKNVFRKMVRFGAFISFPIMLGLAFISKEFIWILLGEKWLSSVPFLQLSCLWGVVMYLWMLYTNLLISHGKSDVYLRGIAYISVFQLLVVVMLSKFGIYQMVIGYILSYYMGILMWHCFVKKIINISIFEVIKDLFPYIVAMMIAFFIAYMVLKNIENIYILIVLKVLIVSIVYISVMYFGKSTIFKECLNFLKK